MAIIGGRSVPPEGRFESDAPASFGRGGTSNEGEGRPVLRGLDLVKSYQPAEPGGAEVVALRGVDIEVRRGEWLAIIGPSGCGKSTLLNVLAGIDRPTAGRVELLGQDLTSMTEASRAKLRLHNVGFIFQRFHLLAVLTARENVELPMAEAGLGRRERAERSRELLDYVGLGKRANHRPTRLSGGEQQRVAIARALANHPAIVFADEPTGELDRATGTQILDLFAAVNGSGATLVTVTHDPAVADRAGRVIEMSDGRVVGDGRGAG